MKILSVNDCKQCISNKEHVIDIRENWEHAIYSIGIQHLPMAQLLEHLADFSKNESLILVCKSGKRAEALANLLETEHYFTNVAIVEGGITAWAEKFDPTNELY